MGIDYETIIKTRPNLLLEGNMLGTISQYDGKGNPDQERLN